MIVSGYGPLTPYGWLAIIAGVTGIDIKYKAHAHEPERKINRGLNEEVILSRTQKMVKELKHELKEYWSCFE